LCYLELDGKNLHNTVSEDFIRSKNEDYTAILDALSPHELTYLNRFSAMKNTIDSEREMYVQLLLNYVRALLNSASVSPDCFSTEVVKGDDHAKKITLSTGSHNNENKNENMNRNRNGNSNSNGNRNNDEKEEHHTNGIMNSESFNTADMITEDAPYSALSTASAAHCSRCISKAIYILRLITTALPSHSTSAQLLHHILNGHAMHAESLKVAKRFMGSTPTYYLGHYLMGSSLLESHRQIEAISALEVAVMLNTDIKDENYDMLMKTKFLTAMAHIDGRAYVTAVPLLRDVVHIMESRTFSKESDLFPGMFRGGRTELRVGRDDLERNTYCALGTALSYVRDNLGAYVALLKCVGSFGNQITVEENDQNTWSEKTTVGAFQVNPSDVMMYSDMYVQLSNVQRSLGFEEEAKSSIKKSEILLERCPQEMKNKRTIRNRENEIKRKNENESENGRERDSDSKKGKDDLINRSIMSNIDNNSNNADSRSGGSNAGVVDEKKKNSTPKDTEREAQDTELVRKEEEEEEEVGEESVVRLESVRNRIRSDSVSDDSKQDNEKDFKKTKTNSKNADNKSNRSNKRNEIEVTNMIVEETATQGREREREILGANAEKKSTAQDVTTEILIAPVSISQEESSITGIEKKVQEKEEKKVEKKVEVKGEVKVEVGIGKGKGEGEGEGKGEGTRTELGEEGGAVVGVGLDGENGMEQSTEGASSAPLSTNTQTTSSSTTPTSTSSTSSTSSTASSDTPHPTESLGTSTSTSNSNSTPSPGNENEKEVAAEAVAGVVKQITKLIDSLPQGAQSKNLLSIGDSEEGSSVAEHSHPVVIAEKEEQGNEEQAKEEKGNDGKEGQEEKGKEEEGKEEKGKEEGGKEEKEDESGVQIEQLKVLAGNETADSLSTIESDKQGSDVITGVRAAVDTAVEVHASAGADVQTDVEADAGLHVVGQGSEESQEGDHGDQRPNETDAKRGGSSLEDASASSTLLVSDPSSGSSSNSSSLSPSLLPSDPSSTSTANSSSLSTDILSSSSPSSASNSSSLPPTLLPSESSSSPTSNSSSLTSSSPTSNSTSWSIPGDGALLPPIPPVSSPKPVPPPPTPAEIRMASQYMMIASAYIGRGDYELALNQLAKAEKKAENYPEMYMLRASVYQALGQVRQNSTHLIIVTIL
jgi:hypothetical protein